MQNAGFPVLVTGAAGTLGSYVAHDLAGSGGKVVMIDRDISALREAASRIAAPSPILVQCDLSDEQNAVSGFTEIDAALGEAPAALVHFAGKIVSRPLVNMLSRDAPRHPFALWKDTLAANLDTAFLAGSLTAERMAMARVKGVIVLVSSVAARGNAGQSAYAAAKAGVEALVRTWAKELGAIGIRVVGIAPGFIDTRATQEALGARGVEHWSRATALRRLGTPAAVAKCVRLALENDFMTGEVITVDGGVAL